MTHRPVTTVRAGVLDVAFERHGDPDGWPVVLLHGFPYDPRCYDRVAAALAADGADVVVPYLRVMGPPASSARRRCAQVSRRRLLSIFANSLPHLA